MKINANCKYLVETCRHRTITKHVVTKEKKDKLKPNVDAHFDLTTGNYWIKNKDNKVIKIFSIGSILWGYLLIIMSKAGDWVPRKAKAEDIAAAIHRIRNLFEDSFEESYFLESQKEPFTAIRWNPARSWRIIKPYQPGAKSDPVADSIGF